MLAWVTLVLGGFVGLIRYSLVPGRAGEPPRSWPIGTHLPRDPQRSTLVLALHPHCPCSRATLAELARIMTKAQGKIVAQVLFIEPHGFPAQWTRTDLWRSASSIRGVSARIDPDGTELARFGAFTSGQVALYDPRGRLTFSGGITGARGHEGDNAGEHEVLEAAFSPNAAIISAPVFGCPLDKNSEHPKRDSRSCPTDS